MADLGEFVAAPDLTPDCTVERVEGSFGSIYRLYCGNVLHDSYGEWHDQELPSWLVPNPHNGGPS